MASNTEHNDQVTPKDQQNRDPLFHSPKSYYSLRPSYCGDFTLKILMNIETTKWRLEAQKEVDIYKIVYAVKEAHAAPLVWLERSEAAGDNVQKLDVPTRAMNVANEPTRTITAIAGASNQMTPVENNPAYEIELVVMRGHESGRVSVVATFWYVPGAEKSIYEDPKYGGWYSKEQVEGLAEAFVSEVVYGEVVRGFEVLDKIREEAKEDGGKDKREEEIGGGKDEGTKIVKLKYGKKKDEGDEQGEGEDEKTKLVRLKYGRKKDGSEQNGEESPGERNAEKSAEKSSQPIVIDLGDEDD